VNHRDTEAQRGREDFTAENSEFSKKRFYFPSGLSENSVVVFRRLLPLFLLWVSVPLW
jgi:hypothetical protein